MNKRALQQHLDACPRHLQIVTRWLEGETFACIGADYGVSKQRVCQIVYKVLAICKQTRAAKRGRVTLVPLIRQLIEEHAAHLRSQLED